MVKLIKIKRKVYILVRKIIYISFLLIKGERINNVMAKY